jgi:hypothetical protein
MSTSTYELLTMSRDLLDMVEMENGVLTVDAEKTLIDFLAKSEDKLYACMTVIRRLDAEAEFIRAEEKRLAERRKGYETAVERIKDLAAALLEAREKLGEEPKVKTPQYTAWLQETESILAPEDITDWPAEWTRTKVEPDKRAALAALKAGTSKPGFCISRKRGVRFR